VPSCCSAAGCGSRCAARARTDARVNRIASAASGRPLWALLAALASFVGFGVAVAVAQPPLSGTLRVSYDVLGISTVGLAVLGLLAPASREGARVRRCTWRPMAVSAGAWAVAALGLSVALTADSAGVPLTRVGTAQWTG